MKFLASTLFLFLLSVALATDEASPPEKTSTQLPDPSITTTVQSTVTTPSPTPPTTKPSTTTEPETTAASTTTEKPTTTTPKPTTTTAEPTTTTAEPKTTTAEPKTTTAKPTTAPPAPTTTQAPIPTPEEGSWNVSDGINTTCIRAELKILFKIPRGEKFEYVALSPNATSTENSNCNASDSQVLELDDTNYRLRMVFEKDETSVYLQNITLMYISPQRMQEDFSNNTRFFAVKSDNSYACSTQLNVPLENATMEVFKIHIQAFRSAGNENFGEEEECEADNPVSDIVPIAVGVTLLALVVIVLIAYLVGRRRNRQKGYQSV